MKKRIIKILILLIFITFIYSFVKIYAMEESGLADSILEYTEEYQNWLALSEEERSKILEPRKYDIIIRKDNNTYLRNLDNVLRVQKMLRANVSESYDLREQIPENVIIKNQGNTNSCWSFASIGALETNLAVRDKINQLPTVVYDFSERHMNYSVVKRAFYDDKVNEYGYAKTLSVGGNFYTATQYLTNGQGAINEEDMPFVDSEANIDLSEIQNKNVTTTLYDTIEFPAVEPSEKDQVMSSIKEHIVNYGGVYAGIHGAKILGDTYNNKTGAIYCDDEEMDHAVLVIGWDDNYDVSNFNENQRPSENGAWIIKNSWGESIKEQLSDLKQNMYDNMQNSAWNSIEDITDEEVISSCEEVYGEGKVTIQDDEVVVELGDNGYMYISYEDCNIYKYLIGIEKATNTKDYDNVYQNDMLGECAVVPISDSGNIYIANVFSRDSSQHETIDRISITTFQGYTCKVFINPNGSSKAKTDLQEVELAKGDSVSFEAGYHVIEFAQPVELTGDSFVVVVQIEDEGQTRYISLEKKVEGTFWQEAEVNAGESFYTNESRLSENDWDDIGIKEHIEGNICVKAYTKIITETEEPGTEEPGTEEPGTEEPGTEEPGTEEPGTEEPGIEEPETQEPGTEKPETEEPGTEEPTLSDFENVKSVITNSKLYFNSSDLSQNSSGITIEISGIKQGDESNTYIYYYYISGTKGDTNITNWTQTEIIQESDGTYSIILNINSEDLENYEEIADSDNMYIYIREIAQINQQSSEQIATLEVENQAEPECYIDGVMVGSIDDVLNYSNNTESADENQEKDNTVVSGILPYTGGTTFKIIISILLIVFGSFAYYKYKTIDK